MEHQPSGAREGPKRDRNWRNRLLLWESVWCSDRIELAKRRGAVVRIECKKCHRHCAPLFIDLRKEVREALAGPVGIRKQFRCGCHLGHIVADFLNLSLTIICRRCGESAVLDAVRILMDLDSSTNIKPETENPLAE